MITEQFKNEYLAARRAWIDHYFSSLNPMQRSAVLATEGPVLILAGAGSGKTTVLIQRIANLLQFGKASDSEILPDSVNEENLSALKSLSPDGEQSASLSPVPPWRILAITFTNKAADELKLRLQAKLGDNAGDIWACTFHAACLRILRRDAELLGYGTGFTIYDTNDSVSLIKRILKERNIDEKLFPPRSILTEISRAKDAKILPDEYLAGARSSSDSRKQRIAEFYSEYSRRLFLANAMDFDDLVLNTVLLLDRFEDRRLYWQQRFSYIMVDEYQDTNHLQYLLVSILAEKHQNLCVVGDDDQSIYRFRGATIENILSFEQQYKNCRTIRLEENYRSTEQILTAANNVIRHNHGRTGKVLWTELGRGEPVRLLTAYNESDEAESIVSSILLNYSRGMRWNDHAILYRMNAQSNQLEYAFKRAGIPYRVVGGTRFFDRSEVKDVLSYLSVVSDPNDELRLLRIINVPPRGIGEKSLETARNLSFVNNLPLFQIMERADSFPELSRSALRMRQFTSMIRDIQEEKLTSDRLFDSVLEKTGYLRMLEESKDPRDQSRIENVHELKTSILTYQSNSGDSSLEGFLSSIALYTDLDSLDREDDYVVMMTIHSAKGLEFPVVYVIGMEEGIFPGLRSIGEQEEMEEERRLCYVAFTRAKQQLILTNAKQRMIFGKTTANKPSRFLNESGLVSDQESTNKLSFQDSPIHSWDRKLHYDRSYGSHQSKFNSSSEKKSSTISSIKSTTPPPLPLLSVGSKVAHQAFGEGVVSKLIPMGGDQLLEISFSNVGTKKLMLKAAARYLTLLD